MLSFLLRALPLGLCCVARVPYATAPAACLVRPRRSCAGSVRNGPRHRPARRQLAGGSSEVFGVGFLPWYGVIQLYRPRSCSCSWTSGAPVSSMYRCVYSLVWANVHHPNELSTTVIRYQTHHTAVYIKLHLQDDTRLTRYSCRLARHGSSARTVGTPHPTTCQCSVTTGNIMRPPLNSTTKPNQQT